MTATPGYGEFPRALLRLDSARAPSDIAKFVRIAYCGNLQGNIILIRGTYIS